jgi:hypothetical protein
MTYIIEKMSGSVGDTGQVTAKVTQQKIYPGPRLRTANEVGADMSQLARINERQPGSDFESLVRPGAGLTVFADLRQFGLTGALLGRFEEWYGQIDPSLGLIGVRRYGRGECCMDSFNGVQEVKDFRLTSIREGCAEASFLGLGGYGRFVLPESMRQYQSLIDEEQRREVALFDPHLKPTFDIELEIMPARDILNGQPCNLSAEPEYGAVDANLMVKCHLGLTKAYSYGNVDEIVIGACDTERHEDPSTGRQFSLDRQIQAICRSEVGPLQFTIGRHGVEEKIAARVVTGDSIRFDINAKVRSALETMGWIK